MLISISGTSDVFFVTQCLTKSCMEFLLEVDCVERVPSSVALLRLIFEVVLVLDFECG